MLAVLVNPTHMGVVVTSSLLALFGFLSLLLRSPRGMQCNSPIKCEPVQVGGRHVNAPLIFI